MPEELRRPAALVGRLRVVALFSHLSNTSAEDDRAALRVFEDGVALAASLGLAPPLRHLAATHAAIDLPETRLGCVRIGIGMYGLSPFADRSSAALGLRPAMTLRGAVAAVRRVPAGKGVSYGYAFRAEDLKEFACSPGRSVRWRVLVRETLVEIYLDDEFVQAYTLPKPPSGRVALVGEAAVVDVEDLAVWQLDL